VVMARYMKEDEESLDEAAGKSFVNAIWSQEKERVSESEQGRTCSMLSVFFFFPVMTPRVQLCKSKTFTSVHCCA